MTTVVVPLILQLGVVDPLPHADEAFRRPQRIDGSAHLYETDGRRAAEVIVSGDHHRYAGREAVRRSDAGKQSSDGHRRRPGRRPEACINSRRGEDPFAPDLAVDVKGHGPPSKRQVGPDVAREAVGDEIGSVQPLPRPLKRLRPVVALSIGA